MSLNLLYYFLFFHIRPQIGSKNPLLASQKENRAIAVHERTERRGRIRAAVLSYVFPDGAGTKTQK